MIAKHNITGIILAGGKSMRMGTDKGLLLINDQPFITYVINGIESLVKDIIIISDHKDHDIFGHKRVNDELKDAGPLSGLCTGLKHSETDYNMVLSCDIPLIKTKILQKLIEEIDPNYDVIQFEVDGKSMPLIAIYKKECYEYCSGLLESGERRLRTAVKGLKTKTISLPPKYARFVQNINTKSELKSIIHETNH